MALTLAEAAKLSNDVVLQGVIETVVKESRVLEALPFIEMVGNALTYNRENAMATAAFFDVGDTWTESTPTFTQVLATLKILRPDAQQRPGHRGRRARAEGEGRRPRVRGRVPLRRHGPRPEGLRRPASSS